MLIILRDQHGVVMTDCLAKSTTITGDYYDSLLENLQEDFKTKKRGMLPKAVSLLKDNVPVYKSLTSISGKGSGAIFNESPSYVLYAVWVTFNHAPTKNLKHEDIMK